MSVAIVRPSVGHERAFIEMVADFEAHDLENAEFYLAAKGNFEKYVLSLLDEERGLNLQQGRVPCTHRWLMESGGAVVGATRLRHNIDTPFLATEGGHIGYDVAPGWRGRGYGHRALQAALEEAQNLEIDRVLLVADESNEASRKVIVRHGGELEAIIFSERLKQRVCRYWIRVPRGDGRKRSWPGHGILTKRGGRHETQRS
jgi:predicted acetyltransferase